MARTRKSAGGVLTSLTLQPGGPVPLFRQIYTQLREGILSGQLSPGKRLPSSRTLARELGAARNTVMNAFDQLKAEGYLEGSVGSGTIVARDLPDDRLLLPAAAIGQAELERNINEFAGFTGFAEAARGGPRDLNPQTGTAFEIDLPADDAFPHETWRRLAAHMFRRRFREVLSIADPRGHAPLRAAIAEHLGPARGIVCTADEVLITSGSQHALDFIVRSLLRPRDQAVIENPGERGVRANMIAAGVAPVAIGVDHDGLKVDELRAMAAQARLAYVTPSNQYPLGGTLSMSRRLELLQWARSNGAWIVEDDCDSEFRYASRPLASLKGLDSHGNVIYIGTFSRSLLRTLRIGYIVAARPLIDALLAVRTIVDRHPPPIEQALIAEFMRLGHFSTHVRRMRRLYGDRQRYLMELAESQLRGLIDLEPSVAGMHLIGWLSRRLDDRVVAEAAAKRGLVTRSLSSFYHGGAAPRPALLLGYTGLTTGRMRRGVGILADVLRQELARAGRGPARPREPRRALQ